MTSVILVITGDKYIKNAVSARLKSLFPQYYVYTASSIEQLNRIDSKIIGIADCTHLLYNDSEYTAEELIEAVTENFCTGCRIVHHPLISKSNPQCILCSEIIESITAVTSNQVNPSVSEDSPYKVPHNSGKTFMMFAFTSVAEREEYIQNNSQFIKADCDFTVRINLMPDYKWPILTFGSSYMEQDNASDLEQGSLSKIMRTLEQEPNTPIDILSYCSMDNKGFMNPGPFDSGDEVFNYHFDTVLNLITQIKQNLKASSVSHNLLVVVQDYRRNEAKLLAKEADTVIILLSSKEYHNVSYLNEEIKSLKMSLRSDVELIQEYI